MKNDSNLLDRTTSGVEITFEAMDLVIIGYLAAHWADTGHAFRCCRPGWGRDSRGKSMVDGNNRWVATKTVRDFDGSKRLGLHFTKHINALNGGTDQKHWWFPMESCRKVTLKIVGVEL